MFRAHFDSFPRVPVGGPDDRWTSPGAHPPYRGGAARFPSAASCGLIALLGRAYMPLSGYRILIVEDEALIALDLSHALEDLHAIVVGSVNNVADARRLVSEATIDCAVLDVQLGHHTVDALIPDLDDRKIPRVFMTAYSEKSLPPDWRSWPVLEKPMAAGELLRAIDRVVSKSHLA